MSVKEATQLSLEDVCSVMRSENDNRSSSLSTKDVSKEHVWVRVMAPSAFPQLSFPPCLREVAEIGTWHLSFSIGFYSTAGCYVGEIRADVLMFACELKFC